MKKDEIIQKRIEAITMTSFEAILDKYCHNVDQLLLKEVRNFYVDNVHYSNGILNCLLGFVLKATKGYIPNRKYLDKTFNDWINNLKIKTPMDAYLYTIRHKTYYSANKIEEHKRIKNYESQIVNTKIDHNTSNALDHVFNKI
jgi:hypothetical protein